MAPSNHTLTNAKLIETFLDVKIGMAKIDKGRWEVEVLTVYE